MPRRFRCVFRRATKCRSRQQSCGEQSCHRPRRYGAWLRMATHALFVAYIRPCVLLKLQGKYLPCVAPYPNSSSCAMRRLNRGAPAKGVDSQVCVTALAFSWVIILAGRQRTLLSSSLRASFASVLSQHKEARMPRNRFAAMHMPWPLPHIKMPFPLR